MSRLDVFVAPRPKRWMLRATSSLNRVVMLHGVPGLRDLWPLSRIPGFRGIADIRRFDLPDADLARLKSVCGPGRATFITPNHPEFFTDWMIDKEILWRVAPMAAAWATHSVVNGLGGLMQRFWLANNLIAQIPGNADAARRHSVEWAARGHGVLLHPEGAVGWHNDYVAPLLPGAVEMACEALELGRKTDSKFSAFVAPIVWKLVFLNDVEPRLRREAAYVAKKLDIDSVSDAVPSAESVFRLYDALLRRDAETYGVSAAPGLSLKVRRQALVDLLKVDLAKAVAAKKDVTSETDLLRAARRWLRENKDADKAARKLVRSLSDDLFRIARLGDFAFKDPMITQEQVAEHLKRLRNDYCIVSLRDRINRFMPRPVGPRVAIVRVPDPIRIDDSHADVDGLLDELRRRLQSSLSEINAALRAAGTLRTAPNPFFGG